MNFILWHKAKIVERLKFKEVTSETTILPSKNKPTNKEKGY